MDPTIILGSLYILAFLIGCSRGRGSWLLVDFLATTVYGATLYFIPRLYLESRMTSQPDVTHMTYCRMLGAMFLTTAVIKHFLRSSKDEWTIGSLIFSSLIGGCLHLFTRIYNIILHGDAWVKKPIFTAILGTALWVVGSIIALAPLRYHGGHAQKHSRINAILRLNGSIMLIASCVFFAFPDIRVDIDTIMTSHDSGHLHMIRLYMAHCIGLAILSLHAPAFFSEAEKRAIFIGQILYFVLMVPVVLYAHWFYDDWAGSFYVYLFIEGVFLTNTLIGYFSPPEEEEGYKGK